MRADLITIRVATTQLCPRLPPVARGVGWDTLSRNARGQHTPKTPYPGFTFLRKIISEAEATNSYFSRTSNYCESARDRDRQWLEAVSSAIELGLNVVRRAACLRPLRHERGT